MNDEQTEQRADARPVVSKKQKGEGNRGLSVSGGTPLDVRWAKLVHYIADRFDQPPIPDGLIINAQVLIKRAGGDGHLNKNTSKMLRALGGVPQRGFGNRIVSYKFDREDFFQLAKEGRPLSCEAVRRPKLERQQQAAQ